MSQLDSAVFTARLKSIQERAKAVRSSILRWNAYAQAQQLRPLFSQLSRGLHLLAPFRAEDPAVGYSPVQTDDLPRPLSAIPGDCGECWLVYPDRPDHWRRGELIPARHVSSPMLATELTQRSQQLRASTFVEELANVGPYGETGPDGFQPVSEEGIGGQTGVSLEQWDPESGSLRTVYPTSVVGGELILRIGDVTNRVRLVDPAFGRLVDVGGGVIEIETTDKNGAVIPHGYANGDELDVLGHFVGAINVLAALPEGAMAYMEFYENNSVSPIGGDMSNSIYKVVAKAQPGPLRIEQISGVDVTVLEFAIGQDIIESSRNLEAALRTVPGLISRFIIRRNYHQIMFFPRNSQVNGGDWTRYIGGIYWALMHYGDVINYQYCMPYYPNVWFDELGDKATQGNQHATIRLGRSLPVVVISSTRIRVAVDADWAPLSMVALARVRKSGDNDLDAPYAMLRPLGANGTVDYDSLFQNLIASIKQSSAYGRYMEDFLTGVGGFTFAYAKGSGGQKITGLGLYHPAGVELAASKGSFRLENFYWSVPQGDAIGVDLPGVFGLKGDGPYRLYRRGELRALKATVTGRFSCQLDTPEDPDLASDRTARLGMIILEDAEVGAELFLGTGQVYTYANGAWVTEGHTSAMQWMLRPYLRLSSGGLKMQATSRISDQSDHQVLYGPPVSLPYPLWSTTITAIRLFSPSGASLLELAGSWSGPVTLPVTAGGPTGVGRIQLDLVGAYPSYEGGHKVFRYGVSKLGLYEASYASRGSFRVGWSVGNGKDIKTIQGLVYNSTGGAIDLIRRGQLRLKIEVPGGGREADGWALVYDTDVYLGRYSDSGFTNSFFPAGGVAVPSGKKQLRISGELRTAAGERPSLTDLLVTYTQ